MSLAKNLKFIVIPLALISCSAYSTAPTPSTQPSYETLQATLWVQTSAEYSALAEQTYRLARLQLEAALADPDWTAAVEQDAATMQSLPLAVILDVDETVLDNSSFEARLIQDNQVYSEETWGVWVREAIAPAVPGALDFIHYARARGVEIYYVTNRHAQHEVETRQNLTQLGFPLAAEGDAVLMKGENDWGSDKSARRREVAKTHRILLLVGDDLNDFVSGARAQEPRSRRELSQNHAEHWGTRWILLPNTVYGSWADSLFGRQFDLTPEEKLHRKSQYLEPLQP